MNILIQIQKAWALEGFKPDVPLSRDEASRFLPWIIALMVYLAALTLVGSFTLHHTVEASHTAQIESFSVNLPRPAEKADELLAGVQKIIDETPGVAQTQIVTTERLKEMLEPWLGKGDAISALPLPMIIEGKLAHGETVDYDALMAKLQAIAPGVTIDDHKQWMAQFSGFVHLVQWVLLAIAFFIISATAAVVVFACKTSLKIHRSTVNLLHRLGAMDGYIAQQFQHHAALLALKGAFVGAGFASGTLFALHILARHIDSPLFPSIAFSLQHWVILLLLPLLMSGLALLSARMSVLSALHKMP